MAKQRIELQHRQRARVSRSHSIRTTARPPKSTSRMLWTAGTVPTVSADPGCCVVDIHVKSGRDPYREFRLPWHGRGRLRTCDAECGPIPES